MRMSITVPDLTAWQVQELAEFVQARLMDGRHVAYAEAPGVRKVDKPQYPLHTLPGVGAPTTNPLPPVVHQRPDPNSKEQLDKMYPGLTGMPPVLTDERLPAPPVVGNVPPPPVTAPPAVHSTSSTPATVSDGPRDKRGVIWHEDHHSGGKTLKKDGTWAARKNSDEAARDAYEAQFAGKAPQADVAALMGPPLTVTPPPPPVPAGVSYATFRTLWVDLCAANKLNADWTNWVINKGGHPSNDGGAYATDAAMRESVYVELLKFV